MEQYAQLIIEEFETNSPIPTSLADWREKAEEIALYLSAVNYIERHG